MDFDDYPPGESGSEEVRIAGARALRFLRPAEVSRRTTLSPAQLYRLQHQGRFPRYEKLDKCWRLCGLYEHVLDAFLAGRIVARAGGLPPIGYRPPLPPWHYRLEDVPVVCGISLLRLRDVERVVGLRRTQIYRLIDQRRFPGPISLGERTARWVLHEVQAWLRQQCPPPGPPGSGLPVPVAPISAYTV